MYREFAPPPALAGHVAAVWTRGGVAAAHVDTGADAAAAAGNGADAAVGAGAGADAAAGAGADGGAVRVLPDGSADIMWLDDGATVSTLVAGPDTEAQLSQLAPGSRMVGIRFAPGAASSVLGVPLDQLRNLRVPLTELWGPAGGELAERVALADRPELALMAAVQPRMTEPADPTATAIARRLDLAAGPAVVARLAEDLGFSGRQLQRRCRAAFGYGPKTLHEVLRFQRALRLARTGGRLADVAAVVGYADQAHMARETRRLAGVPLTDLL
jgi:AraC-like DNA-binding protein